MENSRWVKRPTVPGIWKRRIRKILLPLPDVWVFKDMEELVFTVPNQRDTTFVFGLTSKLCEYKLRRTL